MTISEGLSPTPPAQKAEPVIRSIRVFQSGSGEQHKEHRFGSRLPRSVWALTSRSWVPLPLQYFLIEHCDGLVLFDTGLDPAIALDPRYIESPVGRFLLPRIFRLHIDEADGLDRVLAAGGIQAADIRLAVFSHLHFDHVGGIAHIPQAELVVSARECAQLDAPHPEYDWILRDHVQIPGARWCPFEFASTDDPLLAPFGEAHDLLGDGSMVLLPTPGHTPGSISMLIRRDGWAPILLAGDLTYQVDLLEQDVVPGTGDAKELRASFARVRQLKALLPDLEIVASHDAGAAAALARAQGFAHLAA
ncbi:N-acyl homoserine lactonase family protein [Aliiruegeria sabulilitoris]|uniref:N-acyl homoserine lactonase family protein n=1 Tax=Aliiruegeria sabulilitoris TaxID=1510458 RepID=UPI000836FA63|nr:N-acyl homoserine lactonase family protein [Aliiruegeria sabulilitoris]NDR58667.1 N-acyl homoserine lactonase family protein [Pseudoruegeria sp. M32A2M]